MKFSFAELVDMLLIYGEVQ